MVRVKDEGNDEVICGEGMGDIEGSADGGGKGGEGLGVGDVTAG